MLLQPSLNVSVFSGSFSAHNVLATLPVWGPEYQLSFEFSLSSPCGGGETKCSLIVLTNTTTASLPAIFLDQLTLKISADMGEWGSFDTIQEQCLIHKEKLTSTN